MCVFAWKQTLYLLFVQIFFFPTHRGNHLVVFMGISLYGSFLKRHTAFSVFCCQSFHNFGLSLFIKTLCWMSLLPMNLCVAFTLLHTGMAGIYPRVLSSIYRTSPFVLSVRVTTLLLFLLLPAPLFSRRMHAHTHLQALSLPPSALDLRWYFCFTWRAAWWQVPLWWENGGRCAGGRRDTQKKWLTVE